MKHMTCDCYAATNKIKKKNKIKEQAKREGRQKRGPGFSTNIRTH